MCLKKPSSSMDSNYPREYKIVGAGHGMFYRLGLSGLRQATELVLDRRSSGLGWPVKRPDVEAAIGPLLGSSPAPYGYQRIQALHTRQGLTSDLKTVWATMRRRGWL